MRWLILFLSVLMLASCKCFRRSVQTESGSTLQKDVDILTTGTVKTDTVSLDRRFYVETVEYEYRKIDTAVYVAKITKTGWTTQHHQSETTKKDTTHIREGEAITATDSSNATEVKKDYRGLKNVLWLSAIAVVAFFILKKIVKHVV